MHGVFFSWLDLHELAASGSGLVVHEPCYLHGPGMNILPPQLIYLHGPGMLGPDFLLTAQKLHGPRYLLELVVCFTSPVHEVIICLDFLWIVVEPARAPRSGLYVCTRCTSPCMYRLLPPAWICTGCCWVMHGQRSADLTVLARPAPWI